MRPNLPDQPTTAPEFKTEDVDLACLRGLRFVRLHWRLVVTISALILLPCFWHRRIEAGDLSSHTYNAWLAQLIERGQAPGLYIVPQKTNILVDVLLTRLGSALGFATAEKIVVPLCVLIFVWGAFALIAAASRRAPWFLVPAIAMVAYGWTFEMGFMNYFVSLGLEFFAVALLWRGRATDRLVAVFLSGLAWMAHPMGVLCLAAVTAYLLLGEKMTGAYRWGLLASAFLAVFAVHYYIVHHFRVQYWDTRVFYLMNGADQLVLFGRRYAVLAMAALLFGSACFIFGYAQQRKNAAQNSIRTLLELWAVLLFTAAMIPELIQLPLYAGPVGFPIARLTSITAVVGLCILGQVQPRRWHGVGFSVIAVVFFTWIYRDTGVLNRMESQVEALVSTLPSGRRVTETMQPPAEWRLMFINHMVDRACIGRCFTYSNYEPSSGQFRIRLRHGSPLVTDSPHTSAQMEDGEYTVRPEDLPMTQIYQCDANDWTRLCKRDLVEGEKNGRIGYHPPRQW
jgi:hypothetical protein